MSNINFNNLTVSNSTDLTNMLGKLVYFSLSSVLIEKKDLDNILQACQMHGVPKQKMAPANAFRSATGDIYERKTVAGHTYKIYCRDNKSDGSILRRELVMETLDERTNDYTKLANIWIDKDTNEFFYDELNYYSSVDATQYCELARDLFEKYKLCVNRNQIETIALNMLEGLDAVKVQVHGNLFFVPRKNMHAVTVFEDFIDALNAHNQNTGTLSANSLYVTDDEKQRGKFTAEYYNAVRKEIELYQTKVEHLINTNSPSISVMSRWITKIDALQEKKQRYEDLFRRELTDVDTELKTLKGYSTELQVRISRLAPFRKVA